MSHAAPDQPGSKVGAWIVAAVVSLVGGGVSLVVSVLVAFGFSEGSSDDTVLFWVLAAVSVLVWGGLSGFIASRMTRGALSLPFGLVVSLVVHAALVAMVLPRT